MTFHARSSSLSPGFSAAIRSMMGTQSAGCAFTACETITGFEVPPTAPSDTASASSSGTPESFHQSAPSAVIWAMREVLMWVKSDAGVLAHILAGNFRLRHRGNFDRIFFRLDHQPAAVIGVGQNAKERGEVD